MADVSASPDVLIRRLEDQRYGAVLTGDLETFEGLCHPGLMYTHTGGDRDSLKSYMDKLRTGALHYHRIDHKSEKITVIGNTALVLIQMTADLRVNGSRKAIKCNALAVWVNEAGAWKFIAYQPTARA
ncbi:hypothetical protein QF038_004128 [Pseudarthrobacter sp. W1I19]|uniref:nuclear transport factor 2 family protein n=1 Tax=Pseudarthrobacter sp. W1I19 TaxID=3042288 RepID=UPI0027844E1D|nr:nuclear transport factor 2 family protein [Pseudarthrobacter sp. W1I19]MDQ0925620.1 hypothetical protein [Pseudarthrobacter sp. W1I19]